MTDTAWLAALAACVNVAACAIAARVARTAGLKLCFGTTYGVSVLTAAMLCQGFVAWRIENHAAAIATIVAIAAVAASAVTDAQTGYVFDALTFPCVAIVLVVSWFEHAGGPALIGMAATGGALALLYCATLGRGLGLGDVKLACCIGAALGAASGLAALGAAFVLGGVYAGWLLLARRGRRGDAIAFAPYLSYGMAIVVLYGAVS